MNRRSLLALVIVGVLVALLTVGCGVLPSPSTPTPVPPTDTPTVTPTPLPPTVNLAPDGSGDYASLQEAVEAVPEESTIVLEAGTYELEEPLEIDKMLYLEGAGMEETEIVCEAAEYVVRFGGEGPFSVEGITFRHEGDELADVVLVEGGEVSFSLCRFTGAVREEDGDSYAGLRLQGGTTGTVSNCVIEGNNNVGIRVEGTAEPALEGNICSENESVGLSYVDESGGTASGNTCRYNYHGIRVLDDAQPTLEGNTCNRNVVGISFDDNTGGTVRENECSENTFMGIHLSGNAAPTLEQNVCADNAEMGIAYWGETPKGIARGNECSGSGVGIWVVEHAAPTLEENQCFDNQFGIFYQGPMMASLGLGSGGGVARGNECYDNEIGIVIQEGIDPELVDNNCYDNTEDDIRDMR